MGSTAISPIKVPGFDHFALRYLQQWEGSEKYVHKLMSDPEPAPDAVSKAMHGFRIARSFRGIGDDVARKAVLAEIERAGNNGRESVERLANAFQEEFGKANLSAASKLLWLRRRDGFLIYDANAVVALEWLDKQRKGAGPSIGRDYERFEGRWRAEYKEVEEEVKSAAIRLVDLLPYFQHSHNKRSLQALVSKRWFRERVFDNYLWYVGGQLIDAKRRKSRMSRTGP